MVNLLRGLKSERELQLYLNSRLYVLGIDPRVWRKAQEDNPDPVNMIPTPMIGLESLKTRISWQQVLGLLCEPNPHYDCT